MIKAMVEVDIDKPGHPRVMTKYVTMTAGGICGASFEAEDDELAEVEARRRGYDVLDIIDPDWETSDEVIVVVKQEREEQ